MKVINSKTLDSLKAHAGEAGLKVSAVTPIFEQFITVIGRYAALERLTLGSVPLTFPAHLFTDRAEPGSDPLAFGLALAARERERLGFGHGAIGDVVAEIEAQGLKVVELSIPEETPLLGAFVFDPEFGPAILVTSGTRQARDYALAHEYGHFLADYDPYRTWVCLKGKGAGDSPEELRAHAFAGGFLVPGPDLEMYLHASRVSKGDPISKDLIRQLRAYFEADDRAVIGRLLADGWLHRKDIGGLMRGLRDDPVESGTTAGRPFSARFVNLAVMAVRGGKLTLREMAEHLDVDERTARLIEESFRIDEDGGGRRADSPG